MSGRVRAGLAALAVAASVVLAGCGGAASGALTATSSGVGASVPTVPSGATSSAASSAPGAAVTVTVPDLGGAPVASPPAEPAASPAEPAAPTESSSAPAQEPAVTAPTPAADPTPESTSQAAASAAPSAEPAPPAAGDGNTVPVTLANCPGCTVLATHAGVTGDLSAALVASGTGRALLLSVGPDGAVRGLINIPYGAEFPAPTGEVLPCDSQARCVVTARQSDGRAILSAFELTGTGAWRDVSGNDAFPSATAEGRTVDLDGGLGIAVQDAADGATVWMVFGWSGERYVVVGCSADTAADPGAVGLDLAACLS
ncbi:hypothetical protein JL107_15565 [Nakamurella flavida]|uniref:Uncharacterized protein n=1 Tax=Nakamurella flavida TaxID=363630 RepID=A0A938YR13_9ACTN|nr:hypothetical protein [Nakamurella flavida]MBM9477867.1 hypothetical protein [Nakamurella flavida]MDP9779422.1 hypothetical protein [Nakamurella flavida]